MKSIIKILIIVPVVLFQSGYAALQPPVFMETALKKIKNFLPSFLFSTVSDKSSLTITHPLQRSAMIAHMKVIRELKMRFNKIEDTISPGNVPIFIPTLNQRKLTQTEAYLARYQSEIDLKFGIQLEENKSLIAKIIEQEKQLSDTYYFFYHAHKKELMILHDFIKVLHSYMYLITPRLDFTFMRFKHSMSLPYKNVYEYLDAQSPIDDSNDITRGHMASVNVALFGNHLYYGECTFDYFLADKNASMISLYTYLQSIFNHYGFSTRYLSELTDLTCFLDSPTGNLLQICIPHSMVDDLVYLARPYGMP